MKPTIRISAAALAVSLGWSLPAQAQSADDAAIRQELATMRAQMERMAQRIDTLEGQLAQATKAKAEQQAAAIPTPTIAAKPATEVTWDGAPKFTGPKGSGGDGWSFKPRGRLQIDVSGVDAPAGIVGQQSLGFGSELRRAYIGFDGTLPGGFGYRTEIDVAGSAVEITDLFLTYRPNPKLTLTMGNFKPFWGLEDAQSDLFLSMMERASFNGAFGFERRLGLGAQYADKAVLIQGGVFTDNVNDLNSDRNNSYGFDGRVVFMPKLAGGQVHVGASAHFREFNDQQTSTRYRARPFSRTTDLRLIDTGAISATGERGFGAELAYISGRFHATSEGFWMTALRPGLANPTFHGGYAELGYLLTDDETAYRAGAYDRIRPKHPVGEGGIGAIQVNARYDWLDLNAAGIVGGRQQVAGLSVVWTPTDYVRFLANYGHVWIEDAAVPAALDRDYTADVLGMRAQFDF